MNGPPRARVLVVDDSAFARKVLRDVLAGDPGLDVVGTARDGLEALEKIEELRPDVVTLDLVMPNLDGLGVMRALRPGGPRIVVVSSNSEESELVVEALQIGAVDFIRKPTALATERLYEIGRPLARTVVDAARARRVPGSADQVVLPVRAPTATEIVTIGASTGGPQALTALLTALPPSFPATLAVALHIPSEYTLALAERLDAACAIDVVEARDGLELRPGCAVVARGGAHLEVNRRGPALVASISFTAARYTPSVDVLFESAARACGRAALGVVLTGMGDDGVVGSRALRAAGARIFTQSERTCVVYGMPRAVREAGLSDQEADLDRMAEAIVMAL